MGAGGVAGCVAFAAGAGLALTGITDSSLALFVAGSCVSLPPTMTFISLVAATLVAFEVKWTLLLAQMLVPSTVASSCTGDSSGPKYSRMFYDFCLRGQSTCCSGIRKTLFGSGNLSKEVPILAVRHMGGVGTAGGRDVPWQRYR